MPIEVELVTALGRVRQRIVMEGRHTEVRIALPAAPTELVVDPDGWVLETIVRDG
jgi:hypothetical protein